MQKKNTVRAAAWTSITRLRQNETFNKATECLTVIPTQRLQKEKDNREELTTKRRRCFDNVNLSNVSFEFVIFEH